MPQSTVRTRSTPSSASRSIGLGGEAVALLEAARQPPLDVAPSSRSDEHGDGGRARSRRRRSRRGRRSALPPRPPPGSARPRAAMSPSGSGSWAGRLGREERASPPRGRRARGGRARSPSISLTPSARRGPRRGSSRTVGWSSGRPASPARRYGARRTACRRSGARRTAAACAALAAELQDDLDPQHHDARRWPRPRRPRAARRTPSARASTSSRPRRPARSTSTAATTARHDAARFFTPARLACARCRRAVDQLLLGGGLRARVPRLPVLVRRARLRGAGRAPPP